MRRRDGSDNRQRHENASGGWGGGWGGGLNTVLRVKVVCLFHGSQLQQDGP